MSSEAEKFMNGAVRSYPCGTRRQESKAYSILAGAFKPSSKEIAEDERAVFKRILDTVNSVPAGRRAMKELAALGCTFGLLTGSRTGNGTNAAGFYHQEANRIFLNPNAGYTDLSTVFIHEGRHAVQHHRLGISPSDYRISDYFKYHRAIEADACAHEAEFVHQVRDLRPDIYQESASLPMVKAYAGVREKGGNSKEAMSASFRAWYGYDYYRDFYDVYHRQYIGRFFEHAMQKKNPDLFSRELPSDTIVRGCALSDGKTYIDPAFLTSPEAFSLPVEDKSVFEKQSRAYAGNVPGARFDSSPSLMYSRLWDGTVLPREDRTALVSARQVQSR
jgi:hypothetical protein